MKQQLANHPESQLKASTKCFVVMPFGKKPIRDGSNHIYDFDKVYRVIIQRAIRQAGMQPIRADERIGSTMIHTDMFKDLRDQPVVLADLSLENPNVFYELGIRHVMSDSGTVLICREDSDLPFDVHLSRVIFYKYDGESLDWEEVERVVQKLQFALEQAKRGEPDSPVHALLESVFRINDLAAINQSLYPENGGQNENLVRYQQLVACFWKEGGQNLAQLYKEHRDTIFGARALGYYCLDQNSLPEQARQIAAHLADAEQYELAVQIFSKLKEEDKLEYNDILNYASSYSETYPHISGANRAIALVHEALELVNQRFGNVDLVDDVEAIKAMAQCLRRLAGLQQWRWQLTKDKNDLNTTIQTFQAALNHMERARSLGDFTQPGLIAQAHLKSMTLLRIRDENVERVDVEGHRDAIVGLKPRSGDDPSGISYLNWFQAITLADSGAAEASRRKALATYAEDRILMSNPDYWEVGRRQYTLLRRFIEQYSSGLKNSTLLGGISQILQTGYRQIQNPEAGSY